MVHLKLWGFATKNQQIGNRKLVPSTTFHSPCPLPPCLLPFNLALSQPFTNPLPSPSQSPQEWSRVTHPAEWLWLGVDLDLLSVHSVHKPAEQAESQSLSLGDCWTSQVGINNSILGKLLVLIEWNHSKPKSTLITLSEINHFAFNQFTNQWLTSSIHSSLNSDSVKCQPIIRWESMSEKSSHNN